MFAVAFAALAGIIHLYIFCLESLLWGRPKTNRTFGMTPELSEHNRLFAFNQGFYNLFLGVAALAGVGIGVENPVGKTLVIYSLLSMLLAAVVLICSKSSLVKAAVVQGVPPLIGLIFLLFT